MVAGLVKRAKPGEIFLDELNGIMAYWEPVYGKSGIVGTTCLFESPTVMEATSKQILGQIKLEKPGKLIYYNGAAWDKDGIITSAHAWFAYLSNAKQNMANPIKISFKK